MEDRRREARTRVARKAYSSDVDCRFVYDCFIRDASSVGCKIFATDPSLLPNPLLLFPEGFKQPKVGIVVWRRKYMAGIRFVSDPTDILGPERCANPSFPTFAEIEQRFEAQAASSRNKRAGAKPGPDGDRVPAAPTLRSRLASIVHEFRTPITSIAGAISLVLKLASEVLPAKARQLLLTAQKNTQRLSALVKDLLDLEKLRSGKMSFRLKPADIVPIVREAVDADEPYGETHGVRFRVEDQVGEAYVSVDRSRIQQVVANLLSNAAKFSPDGEEVVVGIDRDGDHIRVSVTDKGVGIAEADQAQIFEQFTQVEGADGKAEQGTGLGLDICRSILKAHGSEIGLRSKVGAGSTFYFDLPELETIDD